MSTSIPWSEANRLTGSGSPYLEQHADNPVHWIPWSEKVFAEARRRDLPVLVSVGYSTCHWCHVMAHRCFEDDRVAAEMNAAQVNVKVDREQHPGVDAAYMEAAGALNGSGGWPLNVFADHEGRPFLAVTYLPPERWVPLVREVNRIWREERNRIDEAAGKLSAHLSSRRFQGDADPSSWPSAFLSSIRNLYDADHPGLANGSTPMKFPPSQAVDWLLEHGGEEGRSMALAVLTAMMDSGLHDRVAGGFHRYSTDPRWRVPHFEKMTYDNAQLIGLYARAADRAGSGALRRDFLAAARGIADWLIREMRVTDDAGSFLGYATATDADDPLGEGAYFAWPPSALEAALGAEDAAWLAARWDIRGEGRLPEVQGGPVFEPVASWIPHPRGAAGYPAAYRGGEADRNPRAAGGAAEAGAAENGDSAENGEVRGGGAPHSAGGAAEAGTAENGASAENGEVRSGGAPHSETGAARDGVSVGSGTVQGGAPHSEIGAATPDGTVDDGPVDHRAATDDAARGKTVQGKAPEFRADGADDAAREAALIETLRSVREGRPAPGRDDKVLTDQNALVLEGLARLARYGGGPVYAEAARELADRLLDRFGLPAESGDQGEPRIVRADGIPAYITDYGYLAMALCGVYAVTGDPRCIAAAQQTADEAVEHLATGKGDYFSTPASDTTLFKRGMEDFDGPSPAGQHALGLAFARLAAVTGHPRWRERADALIAARGALVDAAPSGVPSLVRLGSIRTDPLILVVAGPEDHPGTAALLAEVRRSTGPDLMVAAADAAAAGGADWSELEGRVGLEKPQLLVCREDSCLRPAFSIDEVRDRLASVAETPENRK